MTDGDDPPSSPASPLDVGGTAARTRIREYRPNTGDRDRSLGGLLHWAAECAVKLPDFAKVIPVPVDADWELTRSGVPVDAKYFEAKRVGESELIYWNEPREPYRSVFDNERGAVPIYISDRVLQNDEWFLHILAHEVFELTDLKAVFDTCGGRMSVPRFYYLTEPLGDVKNLHWYAWEQADAVIEGLRGGIK